jgi:glycosyltransferase involved in cell wall biosynthesis
MKIGIDAKWYFEGPPSGKMVVVNLLHELAHCDTMHEFVIFLDRRYKNREFPIKGNRVRIEYIWAANNLISNVLVVPFYAAHHKLDAFIYQNFTSPLGAYRKIACIYDIIFLTHPKYYTWTEKFYFLPLKFLTRYADRVVTISHSEKKRIADHSFKPASVIDVFYLGVDHNFKPRAMQPKELLERVKKRYNLPPAFLLYVGRLNSRKNVANLLRSCALLKNNSIPLVVVGIYDWKAENLDALMEELKIRDKVLFLGAVNAEDLAPLYSLSTVFCFPSFEEAFGLPPLEAMASGVPVVVSHTSSIPEVCGDAGNYIDANDPHDIARMIDELLSNTVLYHQQSQKGLIRARSFLWSTTLRSLLESVERAVPRDVYA